MKMSQQAVAKRMDAIRDRCLVGGLTPDEALALSEEMLELCELQSERNDRVLTAREGVN